MSTSLPPEERRRLAEKVGVNPASLYQALTGKGAGFSPAECVRIERDSEFELRRWDLRPNDWHLIWPELIGTKGAPKLHAAAKAGSAKPKASVAPGPHTEHAKAVTKPARTSLPSSKPKSGSRVSTHTEHAKA